MERKRTGQGKRAGKEQKRGGEVSRCPLQLPDDDRTDVSTAIADGVDEREPRRGAGAGQDRGWQRPEGADGGIKSERGKRQRQHDEGKRPGIGRPGEGRA